MFAWLRRLLNRPSVPLGVTPPAVIPFSWPETAHRLSTRTEVESTHQQERAVVYISVDWSGQERMSRKTFGEFVHRIEREHSGLRVTFWIVTDNSEGIDEWFRTLKLSALAAGGYGALVWLRRGQVQDVEGYAAQAGVESLVKRTLKLWGET
jgi:hypothetical protein